MRDLRSSRPSDRLPHVSGPGQVSRSWDERYGPIGGKKTLMSPRVINWASVRTCHCSVGDGQLWQFLPRDSCRQYTRRDIFEGCLHLWEVNILSHQGRSPLIYYVPIPNLSATPGRYQTGSTANLVTASSPELFKHILPSGTLVSHQQLLPESAENLSDWRKSRG